MIYALDSVKGKIASTLESLCGVSWDKIIPMIEVPKVDTHGDLCIPIPKLISCITNPKEKINPAAYARQLSETFPMEEKMILKTSCLGIFLNFTIDRASLLRESVKEVLTHQSTFGTNSSGQGKTVCIDFSSPNIAKPFHAGHLRSTIIGNFIRKAYQANGWKAIGINYLGDWGKQYGLLAVGFAKYGNEEALVRDPIKHLFDVYVQINKDAEEDASIHDQARALFVRMGQGDEAVLGIWRRFRALSIEKYKEIYARLGVEFDVYSGESTVEHSISKWVDELKERGALIESQGAWLADIPNGPAIVVKKDGASTYLARDIAAANERFLTYKFDKSIYVVASQQDLNFQQLFKILEYKPWASGLLHVNFGMVTGMSTRKGNVVFLEDIIDNASEAMHEVMKKNEAKYAQIQDPEKTAETLAISAIMIQDMSAKRVKNYEFEMERMTSFEGDTGPYLQYAHSRLVSIQRNSALVVDVENVKFELLSEKVALELGFHLAKYPEMVRDLIYTLEPCTMVNYLMALSHLISQAFDQLWVMGQPEDIAKARLALFKSAQIVLNNGLTILGIRPLDRM